MPRRQPQLLDDRRRPVPLPVSRTEHHAPAHARPGPRRPSGTTAAERRPAWQERLAIDRCRRRLLREPDRLAVQEFRSRVRNAGCRPGAGHRTLPPLLQRCVTTNPPQRPSNCHSSMQSVSRASPMSRRLSSPPGRRRSPRHRKPRGQVGDEPLKSEATPGRIRGLRIRDSSCRPYRPG